MPSRPLFLPIALFAGALAFGVAVGVPVQDSSAGDVSPNTVPHGQAGKLQHIRYGTVEGVRRVRIEGSQSGLGLVVGGVGGGLAGSAFGGGKRAKTLTTLGGALAGGYVGSRAERSLTAQGGYEYTIQLDSGENVAVVQGGPRPLAVGDRVQLIETFDNRPSWQRHQDGGGETVRVLPAPPGK